MRIHVNGNTTVGGATDGNFRLDIQSSGSSGTSRCYDQTAVVGSTLCVVRAGAGQSGDVFQIQNNAGTTQGSVGSDFFFNIKGLINNNFGSLATAAGVGIGYTAPQTIDLSSGAAINWGNSGISSTKDTGLARNAAGILEVNNGTAGTYRDLYTRAQTLFGAGTGVKTLQVRGNSSNDANILELQNNAGTAQALFRSDGVLSSTGVIESGASLYGLQTYFDSTSVMRFGSGVGLAWSSTSGFSGTKDTGLVRSAAGVIAMNNGSSTTYALLGSSDSGGLITTVTRTITGAVTDAYTAGVSLTPTYTAATSQTVTRHNYLNLANPVLSGAGPAALTDATVFRFDAAAGTHKAVDAGTTKITVGAVDAWIKVNVNGTLYYMPAYTSKTT